MKADIDLDIGRKTFASGLLPELIAALGRSRPGDLVAVVADEESIGSELETWCRFTGNPLLEAAVEKGRARWVFRCGTVPMPAEDNRPVGSRLWLYTNFDCNLRCDYCCVRSMLSPGFAVITSAELSSPSNTAQPVKYRTLLPGRASASPCW